jgi:hypothetical protein
MMASAVENNEYVHVASLDLSFAFDLIYIDLLPKSLKLIGLPKNVLSLIKIWLKERMHYVSIYCINSVLFDLLLGTIQGSILYVLLTPLFILEPMLVFADDSYVFKANKSIPVLIKDWKSLQRPLQSRLESPGQIEAFKN